MELYAKVFHKEIMDDENKRVLNDEAIILNEFVVENSYSQNNTWVTGLNKRDCEPLDTIVYKVMNIIEGYFPYKDMKIHAIIITILSTDCPYPEKYIFKWKCDVCNDIVEVTIDDGKNLLAICENITLFNYDDLQTKKEYQSLGVKKCAEKLLGFKHVISFDDEERIFIVSLLKQQMELCKQESKKSESNKYIDRYISELKSIYGDVSSFSASTTIQHTKICNCIREFLQDKKDDEYKIKYYRSLERRIMDKCHKCGSGDDL